MVKRLPTMQETQVQSLGWEDLLEKEMATHSSVLAWKIPQTEDPGYQSTDYGPVQFSSVAQSCPTLCNPMDCSTPGFPVHHQLLKLAQTLSIEWVMPSNHLILLSLSPTSNLSQHQGLFQ